MHISVTLSFTANIKWDKMGKVRNIYTKWHLVDLPGGSVAQAPCSQDRFDPRSGN